MMQYPIPPNVDDETLFALLRKYLPGMTQVVYGNGEDAPATALEYDPPLTPAGENVLAALFVQATSRHDLDNLPNWATWTAAQASDYVHQNVLNGLDRAGVDAYIAGLPATVAGMKTGLTQVAYAVIDIRTILEALAKAVVYLRNLILR